ncbi:MAG: hypothetical protein ACREIA_15380 [Opitutaceae bacterium]
MDYRPNPFLAALGSHIRSSRRETLTANLAFLSAAPVSLETRGDSGLDACTGFFIGARDRAEALGFRIEAFQLDPQRLSPRRLQGILESRGVSGIILHRHFTDEEDWPLSWERFAVCAVGAGTLSRRFDCIDVDRFSGLQLILEELRARGYERVGLALLEQQDLYHEGLQRCLVSDYQRRFQPRAAIPHLIVPEFTEAMLDAWISRHRVDAVVAGIDKVHDLIASRVRTLVCIRPARDNRLRPGHGSHRRGGAGRNRRRDRALAFHRRGGRRRRLCRHLLARGHAHQIEPARHCQLDHRRDERVPRRCRCD